MFTHYQKISRLLGNCAAVVLLTIASFGFASFAHAATTTLSYTGDPIDFFTVPQGVTSLTLSLTAGGGGGAGGAFTYGGGGGGAGSSISNIVIPVTPGQTIAYTVGKGGNGGTSGSYAVAGGNGGDGTYTVFGTTTVFGGKGGIGGAVGGGFGQGGLSGGLGGTNGGNGADFVGQRTYGGNGGTTSLGIGGQGGTGNSTTYSLPTAGTNGNGGGAGSGWASGDGTLRDSGRNGGNGLIVVSYTQDLVPPVITINGANPLTLQASSTGVYVDAGATAFDAVYGTTTVIITFNNVNLAATGTYSVVYSTTDPAGNATTSTRIVNVIDTTSPVITSIPAIQIFEATGATTTPVLVPITATDNLTSNPIITYSPTGFALGTTTVTWIATDSSGNFSTATSSVVIKDTTGPAIVLNGLNPMSVMFGTVFTDPSATAFDLVDGTTTVFATGTVNTMATGTYAINYTSTDLSGNISTTSRIVDVVATAPALTTLSIAPINPTVTVGATTTFVATTLDQYGNPFVSSVIWVSMNPSVGNINPSTGAFNALSVGTTTITAFSGALSTSTTVTVSSIVIPPVTTISIINSTVEGTYYLSYATTSGAISSLTGTTTVTDSVTTNSTANNSAIATSTATSTTMDNINLTSSTVTNSTLTNDDITRCTIINSSVTNYFATDCYIAFSVLDPTPLYHFISSTSTGSQIYASNIYNSVINNSYVATSTFHNVNIANSTSTNSVIATSTISNHSNINNSTVTLSNINNSTITGSTITNSTTTDSVISSSTLTNVVSASSTISNTTLSNASTTNAVIDNGIIYSGTITIGGVTYVITTPTLISSLGATSTALVNLGTAANYVILAKTAITTTGVTSITGDLGISPAFSTAMTGFALALDGSGTFSTSSLVNGKIYAADYSSPTPANLTAAVSAMQAAYTDANSRATTVLDAGACITGTCDLAGTTLVGGVYTFNGAGNVTITNDVTLSGSASDVWIFQIPGTLDISANKKIKLTGGALASHIFWAVAGTTTIKPGATFSGVILAGPGASTIAMQNGAVLNGRALGQTDVTLIGNTVTVSTSTPDTTAPVITILGSNPVNLTVGQSYTDAGATAFDAFDATATAVTATGTVNTSVVGTYTIVYSSSDAAGNTATSSRIVNVASGGGIPDTTAPVITINGANPVNMTVGGTYTDAGATAQDNVDGNVTSRIATSTNLNTSVAGTYTFTYTVSDLAGNTASSSRIINVSSIIIPDTTAPVITINGANPVTVLAGSTYTDAGATAQDNVDGNVTSRIVTTNPVNASSTAGTYSVVYTVSDNAGNTASSTRTVHVVTTPDTTAPVITILGSNPANVVVGTTYVDAGATATDNIDGVITGNITSTNNVNTVATGTYSVVYSVTDGAGNLATSSRTVNVIPGLVDNVAPVITITGGTPTTINVGSTYTDAGATATDNIDGNVTSRIVTTGLPINTSATGTFAVIYTVADNAGNTSVATRTVDVIIAPIDNVAPVITITGGTPTTVVASSTYADAGATAVDNVDGNVPVITLSNNVDTNTLGTYSVVYQASDTAGNIAQATRTVNVVVATSTDNIPPVITLINGTPVTITVGSTYTDAGATALDNVDGDVTSKIASSSNVNTSVVGTYTVTYTVSDTAGNVATATRTVDVVAATADTVAPVITITGGTPTTVVLNSTYTDAGATALDNVDGDITSKIATVNNVNTAATGTYSVTYTVSDTAGNTSVAVRTVNVIALDTIAPIITINGANPMDIIKTRPYTELGATALDNVDGNVSVTTSGSVNTAVLGTYIITYTAKDSSNNQATSTRVVNVINDNIPPVITITGANPVRINVGSTYTDAGATATDNIDGSITASIVTTNPISTSTPVGAYSVIYTVTDSSGNTTVAIRTVNIVVPDTTAPVLTINGANPVNVTVGTVYTDAGATAIDNVDGDISANIVKTGFVNTSILGTYTVTYNVSDSSGNAATPATRTINVVPASSNGNGGNTTSGGGGNTNSTPPTIVITGQNPVSVIVGGSYADAGANAYDSTDNNITSKIVVTNSVNTSVAGTYTVKYSVTDRNNNTTVATRVVNVNNVSGGTNTTAPTAPTSTPVSAPFTVVTEPSQTTVTPVTTGGQGTGVSSGSNSIPFIDLGNTLPVKTIGTTPASTTVSASSSVAQATSTSRNGFLATVGLALGGMSKNILAILLSIIVLAIAGFMIYKVHKEE